MILSFRGATLIKGPWGGRWTQVGLVGARACSACMAVATRRRVAVALVPANAHWNGSWKWPRSWALPLAMGAVLGPTLGPA